MQGGCTVKKGQVRYRGWKDTGFPGWLRQRMKDRGWNALRLSKEVNVVPSLISRWMEEKQKPSPESVLAIAAALQVDDIEAMVAAGYLPPRQTDAATDDPRRQELLRKIGAIPLTAERYRTLNALLNMMLDTADSDDTSERGG